MSAYRTIIEVLRNVAPRKLNGRQIHAADPAHELQVVHMALHDMQKPDGPLQRAKEESGPFIYGLREGFDWQAWLDEKEGRMRSPRDATPKQEPAPAVRIVHSVADRRDSAMAPVPVAAPIQKAAPLAVSQAPERQPVQRTSPEPAIDAANGNAADRPVPRVHSFALPIPGKASAFVSLPGDIDLEDWRMLKSILDHYVARIEQQRSGAAA